ncbi:hypothetical protein [uncultured Methanobrevibacter sp.]|uniref:hypothetical protein n=1 Tax=uncultured Methanobrevibacter sp. TaxID=253161 RepID=UPI00261B2DF4|nr:hypothetical protein [uncultured Methanobrevibacter sp.]
MNIKGKYTFNIQVQNMFINKTIRIRGENIITMLGESFFLNRWVNGEFKPISYICLGQGMNKPQRKDQELGKEIIRKKCNNRVDLKNKTLILSAEFEANEINKTTEIGVSNGDILISHDTYNELTIPNGISNITVDYQFVLETGAIRNDWKQSTIHKGLYYIYEPNEVIGVTEQDNESGYVKKQNINDLTTDNTYYYDPAKKYLYIRPGNADGPIINKIIIKTK